MIIQSYSFGKITIDSVDYDKDLIVLPNSIIKGWWRHTSHIFDTDDCSEILSSDVELIIFGLGAYGLVKLDPALVDLLKSKNIPYEAAPTADAVKIFNENYPLRKTAGAFHLTC